MGTIGNVQHFSTSTVTTMSAIECGMVMRSSGGGTDAVGVDCYPTGRVGGGSGTFTNAYGVRIGTFGAGFTNTYGIHVADTGADNVFAGSISPGKIRIGGTLYTLSVVAGIVHAT